MSTASDAPLDRRSRSAATAALTLLLSINLFNYIDRCILSAVVPRIAKTYFDNDPAALEKTGALATAFTLSYILAAPVFGWLADRVSRWMLIGIGVILWSLASGASGLAPTFTALLLTRLFIGIGEAAYGPAAPTIISDLYPIEHRGAALSWFYMAIPVGSAIGYAWGGLFDAWLGWRWAFYAVVPPGIILGLFCFTRRDKRRSSDRTRAKLSDYTSLLRNRSFLLDCAGMTAMTFAIGGVQFWMPHYLEEYRGLSSTQANVVFGIICAIAGIVATLLGGMVGDRLRRRMPGAYFIVSAVGIFLSCPFVLLMLRTPFPYAWGVIFCAVFFLFFNTGPSNAILANVTPPSVRATAFAANIFLIHVLGDAASPPLLGKIVGKGQHWDRAFVFVTAIMALAATLWLWGAKYLKEDTDRVTALST